MERVFRKVLRRKAEIIGEEPYLILLFVIIFSYKMNDTLQGLILDSSGSGKTRLLKVISYLMPDEDVKRYTRDTRQRFLRVDPARTQSISDISTWDRAKRTVGRGSWPGLEKYRGEYINWLTPSSGTNTFGRRGLTIQGSAVPGSAGCIDLTSRNNSFHSWLKSHGKPLNLNVKY